MKKAKQIRDIMSPDIPADEVKPSELLEVALHDMKLISKNSRYSFDMTKWHDNRKKCRVCMAGSVMARLKPYAHLNKLSPDSFEIETSIKLQAVDYIRRFDIKSAWSLLQRGPSSDFSIPYDLKFNADQEKVVIKYFDHGSFGDYGIPGKMFLNSDYEDIVSNPIEHLDVYENLIKDLKSVDL